MLKRLLPGLAAIAAIGLASTFAHAAPIGSASDQALNSKGVNIKYNYAGSTIAKVIPLDASVLLGAVIGNNTVIQGSKMLGQTLSGAAKMAKTIDAKNNAAGYDQANINGVVTSARRLM